MGTLSLAGKKTRDYSAFIRKNKPLGSHQTIAQGKVHLDASAIYRMCVVKPRIFVILSQA
jgi:hypothetical protein